MFKLYAQGVLRGWSVGFVPARAVPSRRPAGRPPAGRATRSGTCSNTRRCRSRRTREALTLAVQKGLVTDAELRHWLVRDVLAALLA